MNTLGRLLDPLTQDACIFYGDHGLFDDYTGVVLSTDEGKRIAAALGPHKAVILRNHGLLTAGATVDAVSVNGDQVTVKVTVPRKSVILSAVGVHDLSQSASATATAIFGGARTTGGAAG